MTSDAERKRQLLGRWLESRSDCLVPLHPGGALDVARTLQALSQVLGERAAQNSVYVLVRTAEPLRPLYIGKSTTPLSRWKSHLTSMVGGKASYGRWHSHFTESLSLYVIAEESIHPSPIPGFPATVGSVEYQLIGLAQDAFDGLLNVDGVAR